MSTDVKPVQGRHRAMVDTRSAFPPYALPLLLGGAASVIAAVLVTWQVV